MSEQLVQSRLVSFLRMWYDPDVLLIHGVEGSDRDKSRASRIKRSGWLKGWPDLTFLPSGRYRKGYTPEEAPFWIELKTSTGSVSKAQTELFDYFWQYGRRVYVVRGYDELIRVLFRGGMIDCLGIDDVNLSSTVMSRVAKGLRIFQAMGWDVAAKRRLKFRIDEDELRQPEGIISIEKPWLIRGFENMEDFEGLAQRPNDPGVRDRFREMLEEKEKLADQIDLLDNYPPVAPVGERFCDLIAPSTDCSRPAMGY